MLSKPYKRAQLHFEDVREIGSDGKNSKTWIVNDVQLGGEIVMKKIAKVDLPDADEFFDEAKALYATAHQNVVQIHYCCEDDDTIFIAMPFYERGSVKGLMGEKRLTVREIVRLGCQTLTGLHNIHVKGLIHFDIKPDNILLTKRGEAMLADFGLAGRMELGEATPNGLYLRMAPPEATAGPPFNLSFDIYQIGLTLYRMAVGSKAFDKQFARFVPQPGTIDTGKLGNELLAGTFPDRKAFDEHIPARLRKVIVKCLEPNAADRYQSALAVTNGLASVAECLDWRLEDDGVDKVWIKNETGTQSRFVVHGNGSTIFTVQKDNKQARRKTALCKPSMTQTQIRKVLKDN
ncbi:serine/threonine-protein kinase [Altererythrobacter sp. MTPC7]|uniref:serine/threonine-protein kinase n=1 Tax=Altererythrobacter sp. MTPC7 TaxID=3056567 RepID=UPI0036F1FF7A